MRAIQYISVLVAISFALTGCSSAAPKPNSSPTITVAASPTSTPSPTPTATRPHVQFKTSGPLVTWRQSEERQVLFADTPSDFSRLCRKVVAAPSRSEQVFADRDGHTYTVYGINSPDGFMPNDTRLAAAAVFVREPGTCSSVFGAYVKHRDNDSPGTTIIRTKDALGWQVTLSEEPRGQSIRHNRLDSNWGLGEGPVLISPPPAARTTHDMVNSSANTAELERRASSLMRAEANDS